MQRRDDVKTVRLTTAVYQRLAQQGSVGQTFSDVVDELLNKAGIQK